MQKKVVSKHSGVFMSFIDFIKQEKSVTDRALQRFLDQTIMKAREEDVGYGELAETITQQVMRGGKRIRPALVRLGFGLNGSEISSAVVESSLATEFVHQFFMVHDDVVDRDYKRYGADTVEIVFRDKFRKKHGKRNEHYGTSMAIIAGDLLRSWGLETLLTADIDPDKKNRCALLLTNTIQTTINGWQIQFGLNFDDIDIKSEDRFMKGLELVTSRYTFETPLMMGLMLAGTENIYGETLKTYAHHVGVAYQMMDDVLGVFGNSSKMGKPVGNDIREGKKTLLVQRAYQKAGGVEQRFLRDVVGKEDLNDEELNEVQMIMQETKAYDTVVTMAQTHGEKAQKILEKLDGVDTKVVKQLDELAMFVADREF